MSPQEKALECLLVSPPGDVPRYPYLGLCFLAGVLKRENIGVEILDCASKNLSAPQAVSRIAEIRPRVVGVSVMSMTLPACYQLIAGIKKALPSCIVTVGGAHINADPRAVRSLGADHGFHGESEFSFAEFCKKILRTGGDVSGIPGLIFYDKKRNLVVNPPDLIADLDTIPDPAYELVLDNSYYNPDTDAKVAPVITSRGCPYDCIYCSKVQKTQYRYVSNDRVLGLLKILSEKHGAKRFVFVDEIFTVNKARVQDLCGKILAAKMNIVWGCATRADAVDDALLETMRAAGCDKISFGVETGSEAIRFAGNKRIPNRVYEEVFRMCQKRKIKTMADYIFGHPGETLKDMLSTVLFSIKLNSNYAFFHKMLPIPDSQLYRTYEAETGKKGAWEAFMRGEADHPIYDSRNTRKAWADFVYKLSWYAFYLSPLRFFQNLTALKNPKALWNSLKTFLLFSGSRRYRPLPGEKVQRRSLVTGPGGSLPGLRDRPLLLSFLSAAVLTLSLCLAFTTRWETGDDVAMSMVAHGYGLAAHGSPYLLYSNVLWGSLVRCLPAINGVLGYSLATIAVLCAVAWALFYFLLRLGAGYLPGFLATALVIARPVLFPQHMINAGLLTAAAVLGFHVYERSKRAGCLVSACLLAFFGYLIRDKEFFLVLAVALPLLPWQALGRQRPVQIAAAVLALAITLAAAFNQTAYDNPEWKALRELDLARAPFSDFRAGEHLKERPEILARHGYSKNDIDLVSNNFFLDPEIADPKALNAMLAEIGPLFMQKGNIASGFSSLKTLTRSALLPLLLSGLLLLVILPQRSVLLAWGFCLAASFFIGMMGRPGFLRVYFPLLSLLVIAPLAWGKVPEGTRRRMVALILLLACVGNACLLAPLVDASRFFMRQVKKDILSLPPGVIFSWGGPTFPYELAFPVLLNDPKIRKIKLDPLFLFSHAPFSVSTAEQKAGRGMIRRFRSPEGVPVITSEKRTAMLGIYCRERLNGHLQGAVVHETPTMTIRQLRCVTDR